MESPTNLIKTATHFITNKLQCRGKPNIYFKCKFYRNDCLAIEIITIRNWSNIYPFSVLN